MKNLLLLAFLSLTMFLSGCNRQLMAQTQSPQTLPAFEQGDTLQAVQAQQPQTPGKGGLFSFLATKTKEAGLTILFGLIGVFLARKGWLLRIKYIARKCTFIFKESGELLLACGRATDTIDKSILESNKLKENSLKEMLAAKKDVVAEFEDMVVIFKSKKQ